MRQTGQFSMSYCGDDQERNPQEGFAGIVSAHQSGSVVYFISKCRLLKFLLIKILFSHLGYLKKKNYSRIIRTAGQKRKTGVMVLAVSLLIG